MTPERDRLVIPFPQRDAGTSRPVARERITPQSLEAEQSTLGAWLMDKGAIGEAMEILGGTEDFYREIHRKLATALLDMLQAGADIDLVTVVEELRRRGWLEETGGTAYLTALIEACPSSANVAAYARVVNEKATLRNLLRACEEISADAYGSDKMVTEQVDAAGARLFALGHRSAGGGFEHAARIVDAEFERVKARRESPGTVVGQSSGFPDLDALTGGLHSGEMTVVAGRPATGKTSLVMQMALHVAQGGFTSGPSGQQIGDEPAPRFEPRPVAFVSLEMSKEMLLRRMLAQVAGVDSQAMNRGYLDDAAFERVRTANWLIRASKLYLDDARGSTTFQMLARVRKLAAEAGTPGLIVVDYLQLASSAGKRENRLQEIGSICRSLREMALQFRCPVVALAQLSRAVEQRDDKRPVLSDLRESGDIEATADNVALIFRPGYYAAMKGDEENVDPRTEIIVSKQRNGPTGTVKLIFQPAFSRFVTAAYEYQEQRGREVYCG